MSSNKDSSGFTPQERHQIIVDYLKQVNKPTKVFHLRWKPGELLTGQVLETTPMFWYMKYQWGRAEIEEMFYKARCVIGPLFDMALQQTYGGNAGPRWRGAVPQKATSAWRQRQAEKAAQWQAEEAEKLKQKEEEEKQRAVNVQRHKEDEQRRRAENERLQREAEKTLGYKGKDIWNAVSDFGADRSIDYKKFSDNLKDRGINVSPLLAKQLFDTLSGRDGKMNRQQMDDLIKKLDLMDQSATVKWEMFGDTLGCMTIMKRVLLAAGAGTPFNVDDFVFAQKFGVTISPVQFMNKLSDRDVNWDDRVRAMEQLGANLGNNPLFNNVLAKGNIPDLLCGWATQILDNKPEVQKTAIDTIPGVFHNAMVFGDKDIAVGYLEEVLDNLFKVLDDPNASKNHKAAKKAINALVDDIIANGDPESVLVTSHILAEKCDIENANNPESRETALNNLQKIMFGDPSPIVNRLQDKTKKDPPVDIFNNLPPVGSVNREWLDIGTNKIPGPSQNYLEKQNGNPKFGANSDDPRRPNNSIPQNPKQPPNPNEIESDPDIDEEGMAFNMKDGKDVDPYYDFPGDPRRRRQKRKIVELKFPSDVPERYKDTEYSGLKPRNYDPAKLQPDYEKKYDSGVGPNEKMQHVPTDPAGPYAHVSSNPTNARVKQPVDFDASKSHDTDNEPCKTFKWDFGDGSPQVTTKGPYTTHPYQYAGVYPVKVVVTDKYGKTAPATLQQRVFDPRGPNKIGPPYAALTGNPPTTKVGQLATFDASKSHDFQNKPCVNFVFDFGDGTKPVHSTRPVVKHPYDMRGAYPVSVVVTDKHGQKAKASLQHRVIDPELPDPTGPCAAVTSTPSEAKPNQAVTFDASRSKDCDGDPVKLYKWNFGDNTKPVTTQTPEVVHKYAKPGSYPVTVEVVDKYGKTAQAKLTQRVVDPKNPSGPPYAHLLNKPPVSDIDEPVTFDSSKSHDFKGDPCVKFVWDFGDGSPKKTTDTPITQHPYKQPGSYPVTVMVFDKLGQPAEAAVNQRVRTPPQPNSFANIPNPIEPGIEPPYVTATSDPSNARPKQKVKFDASKSHDFKGEPLVTYIWNFGDGTPKVETKGPITHHPYAEPGTYPVRVTGIDKYGQPGYAKLSQRVSDPKNPNKPAPPYAHIKSNPPISNPKQLVAFDSSKSHDQFNKPCVKFVWDFGDGTPKVTTKTPHTNHAYDNPGAYPVSVVVTDKNGLSAQAALTQRVRNPPKPEIADPYVAVRSTPSKAMPKEPVLFDASDSVDMEGDPCKTFVWDFGDGSPLQTTTTPIVNHAYDNPGTYPVKVTATDKYNRQGTAGLNQRVLDPKNPTKIGPPYAAVRSNPQDSMINQPVTFDASKSHDFEGNPCKSFLWDFGDNTPKVTTKGPITKHPYARAGVYPVTVEVTDKHGQKASAGLNQRVRAPQIEDPYVALNNEPPVSKPKQRVKFDASKSMDMDGDPCKNYVFDFGDGSPPVESSKPIVHHPYDEPGSYPVTVTATDKYGRKGNASVTQRVIDPKNPSKVLPPTAHVRSNPPESRPKQNVTFDASKSQDFKGKPCVKFVWDFGDGSPKRTTDGPITQHPYQRIGAYPVTVQVTDKYNQTADASLTQRVTEPTIQDPYVVLDNNPPISRPKQPVEFDASKSMDMDGDPCKNYVFDFGDGSPPVETTKPVVHHPYAEPGSYPVTVTATDKYGRKGHAGVTQLVIDPKNPGKVLPPTAHVRSNPPESRPRQNVTFDASKSQDFKGKPCVKFVWDFGDGSPQKTTKGPITQHPYQRIGAYPVTVQVTDKYNQTADASLTQRVAEPNIEDPYVALNNIPPISRPKQQVEFDASKSVDMDGDPCKNYVFDFGDGSPTVETPKPIVHHPYAEPGSYPVTVTATDKYGRKGNASVTQLVIDPKNPSKVFPPTAHVTSDPPDSRPKQPVTFDASKSHDFKNEPCVNFVWDFGDGSPKKTTKGPITKHPYQKPGVYPVTVEVTDKYNQTANASLQQRCSDPARYDDDPSRGSRAPKSKNYGGKRGHQPRTSPDPVGKFGTRGKNASPQSFANIPPERKEPEMPPDEIGDEFRNVVHDAISKAIMDPNPQNQRAATKTAAVFSKLDPSFMQKCDPEAKKRYEWGLKPWKPKNPKPLPNKPKYLPGKKALHPVQFEVNVDVGKPIMPDI